MARVFTQKCRECGSKGVIIKTNRIHTDYNRSYCECKNPDCGHLWVIDTNYSHTVRPPKHQKNALLYYLLEQLPPEERLQLRKTLEGLDK